MVEHRAIRRGASIMPLNFSTSGFWVMVPFALTLSVFCCAQAPVPEPATDQETEQARRFTPN